MFPFYAAGYSNKKHLFTVDIVFPDCLVHEYQESENQRNKRKILNQKIYQYFTHQIKYEFYISKDTVDNTSSKFLIFPYLRKELLLFQNKHVV